MKESNSSEGWLVVFAGFLTLTVAAGIGWYTFPVYLGPIHEDLGWGIDKLTFAVTIWALAGAAFSPTVGGWIQKYGPRKVMTIGTIVQIVVTILLSRMTALWHMYALFVGAAFASTANTYIPISTAISQWFDEKRGTAMGIAMLGMGVAGIVVPSLAVVFLEKYGWRTGYFIFSFFLIALLVPINLWIRKGPAAGGDKEDEGSSSHTNPSADPAVDASVEGVTGLMASESMRTRSFWGLGLGDFLIGILFTAVIINMPFFTESAGVSKWGATRAYSTFLAFTAIGIFIFGAAADKIKIRWLMILCYGIPAIAMLFLFRLPSLFFLYSFAVVFGTTGGGRNALWPLSLSECFGVKDIGTIYGWLNIPFMFGSAIGPALGGYIYTRSGDYQMFFTLCVAASAVSIPFISLMRREYDRARPPGDRQGGE
jgi:MFS family permease